MKRNKPISVSPSVEEQTKAINTLTRDDILQQVGLALSTLDPTIYSYEMAKEDWGEVIKVTVWKGQAFLGQCHLVDGAFAPRLTSDDQELAQEWEEKCRMIRMCLTGRAIFKPRPIDPAIMERLEKTIPLYYQGLNYRSIDFQTGVGPEQVKKDVAVLRELRLVEQLPYRPPKK